MVLNPILHAYYNTQKNSGLRMLQKAQVKMRDSRSVIASSYLNFPSSREIADPSEYPIQCHRCKVLEMQCSYARSSVEVERQTPVPLSLSIRTKVQACAACRKQKTRCEILGQ